MKIYPSAPRERLPGQPWSICEAAMFLQVSERHLVRQIDAGKVKTIRLGRRRFVPDVELQRIATDGLE